MANRPVVGTCVSDQRLWEAQKCIRLLGGSSGRCGRASELFSLFSETLIGVQVLNVPHPTPPRSPFDQALSIRIESASVGPSQSHPKRAGRPGHDESGRPHGRVDLVQGVAHVQVEKPASHEAKRGANAGQEIGIGLVVGFPHRHVRTVNTSVPPQAKGLEREPFHGSRSARPAAGWPAPASARNPLATSPAGTGLGRGGGMARGSFQGYGRCWTRTSDPYDVSVVLYRLS